MAEGGIFLTAEMDRGQSGERTDIKSDCMTPFPPYQWECSARGAWAETHDQVPHPLGTNPPRYLAPQVSTPLGTYPHRVSAGYLGFGYLLG